jgi:hypothetical protein
MNEWTAEKKDGPIYTARIPTALEPDYQGLQGKGWMVRSA